MDYRQHLLETRYFMEGEQTWEELVNRVATHAAPDDTFMRTMYRTAIEQYDFLPSRMPYMGTEHPFVSSCFVLGPIEDSRKSILEVMTDMAEVQAFGGGTGYNFSHLRPAGDLISTTKGKASGPVSFMKLYNYMTLIITRAGKKHGAQMGILNVDHPDIREFIHMKDQETDMVNFNVSVAVTDEFMEAVKNDEPWDLEFEGKVYETVSARGLFREIAEHAHKNGEPGLIYIDTVNRYNNYPVEIEATNACSEQPLPPYCSCNLASLNLGNFVYRDADGAHINWGDLEVVTRLGVWFLNDSINHGWWPLEKVRENTLKYRNIGLGVMGLADMLIKLEIPYASEEAVELSGKLAEFIQRKAIVAGRDYAADHGTVMNTTLTTVAPTGSISILADCSSGIEPLFGIGFTKNTTLGQTFQVNPLFEEYAKRHGFYSEALVKEAARIGTVQSLDIPDEAKELFRTGTEIPWRQHVRMQAAWQAHFDAAVSKTINMPNWATVRDVEDAFMMAWETECKSTTVYRDGSRQTQAIDVGSDNISQDLSSVGLQMDVPLADGECLDCTV